MNNITVEPRIKGKIIEMNGQKYPSFSFATSRENIGERDLKVIYNQFKAWTGTEDIEVSHSYFDDFSKTWVTLSAYYGVEKRFVKF